MRSSSSEATQPPPPEIGNAADGGEAGRSDGGAGRIGAGAPAARAERAVTPPPSQTGPVGGDGHAARPAPAAGGQGADSTTARLAAWVVRFIAGVAILAGAVLVAGVLVMNQRQALQAPVDEVVQRVRVVEAQPRAAEAVARRWEGFGTARARDQADVATEVSARVISRPAGIDPGATVTVGEVLVRLEESDFRERQEAAQRAAESLEAQLEGVDVEEARLTEQVAQATEQVRLGQWELERVERARAGAAASELEVVRLQAAVGRLEGERLALQQALDAVPSRRAALRADLAARRNDAAVAQRQLTRTTITSPISGVLQSVDVNVGETLQIGQRVARVVDLGRIEVPLRLPAGAQGGVRVGDAATVQAGGVGMAGGPAQTWPARVARIAPEADPATRTVTVFLEVQQETPSAGSAGWETLLLPGRFVSAQLGARAGNGEMLIIVPRRAVVDDTVWVALTTGEGEERRTRAQPRQVRVRYHVDGRYPELDADETQWAVIGAGVEPGDRVIVTNLDDLTPGVRVEVVGSSGEGTEAQRHRGTE